MSALTKDDDSWSVLYPHWRLVVQHSVTIEGGNVIALAEAVEDVGDMVIDFLKKERKRRSQMQQEVHMSTTPPSDWRTKHYKVWEMRTWCEHRSDMISDLFCSRSDSYRLDENKIESIEREAWPEIDGILKKKVPRYVPTDFIKYTHVEHLVSDTIENEAVLQDNLKPILRGVCDLPGLYQWIPYVTSLLPRIM